MSGWILQRLPLDVLSLGVDESTFPFDKAKELRIENLRSVHRDKNAAMLENCEPADPEATSVGS